MESDFVKEDVDEGAVCGVCGQCQKPRTVHERSLWGIATVPAGFYDADGMWRTAVAGYLKVVTDSYWGIGFRSTEKWQLLVFENADVKEPAVILPGCSVKGIVQCEIEPATLRITPSILIVGSQRS